MPMLARVYAPTPANLRRLAKALRRGDLVAIPTETVYGLAAHALDPKACRAIFRAKRRPANDPLIVHVLDLSRAEDLAVFNPAARAFARNISDTTLSCSGSSGSAAMMSSAA